MIKMINTGIGIMILIIPYAFASVIKQLQMEEEMARQILNAKLIPFILLIELHIYRHLYKNSWYSGEERKF